MKILLPIITAIFFTACDDSFMKSYNDLAEEVITSSEYSSECIAYAKPINSSTKISQEGYTRFVVRLEACKTREIFDNFAN